MEEKRSSLIQRAKVLQEQTQAPPVTVPDSSRQVNEDLSRAVREKKKLSIRF